MSRNNKKSRSKKVALTPRDKMWVGITGLVSKIEAFPEQSSIPEDRQRDRQLEKQDVGASARPA